MIELLRECRPFILAAWERAPGGALGPIGDLLKRLDAALAGKAAEHNAVIWGPECQNYPGGPVHRVGVSTGATLPEQNAAPQSTINRSGEPDASVGGTTAGAAPCAYSDGCQYLTHGDCEREGKCLGGWPFSEGAAPGLPEEWQDGIAGHCNIVTYDGADIVGVAGVPSDTHREKIIKKYNTLRTLYLRAVKERDDAWAAVRATSYCCEVHRDGDGGQPMCGACRTALHEHAAAILAARRGR